MIFVQAVLFLVVGFAFAEESKTHSAPHNETIDYKAFDANNLKLFVGNNGLFARQVDEQGNIYSGFLVNDTKSGYRQLAFSSGLILAAVIDDSIHAMINQFHADEYL